jgi:hypothetical protein
MDSLPHFIDKIIKECDPSNLHIDPRPRGLGHLHAGSKGPPSHHWGPQEPCLANCPDFVEVVLLQFRKLVPPE